LALVRALAEQGLMTFSTRDAQASATHLKPAPANVTLLLHRLARAGLVRRIKRGMYTLAATMPGTQEPHPFVIAMALVSPSAISGWSALNHHGLTEQIPQAVTLTTPRRVVTPAMRGAARGAASNWEVSGQKFNIVTVIPSHFFGHEDAWFGDSRAQVFTRERALLDCFALPRRFGGLAEGLGILDEHLKALDLARLVEFAQRYGTASVARRVGYALELMGTRASVTRTLLASAARGYQPLDPTRPARGRRNLRWGLIENLAIGRT
jgi:predicted transcriptional regulator of viral defense system